MKESLTLITVLLVLNAFGQAPVNDNCENASVISAGTDIAFNSVSATTDGPEHSNAACFSFGTDLVHNDIWFEFTAGTSGFMEWNTCSTANFDTRLAVYNAGATCPLEDTDLLACNDDGLACDNFTSSVFFEAVAGETYLLRLGGFVEGDFGEGTFDLIEISEPIFSGHSDCADNDFVGVVTQEQADNNEGWVFGDNLFAPAQDGVEPPSCFPLGEFYDVWYAFNSGINDTIIFNFESFTDTADYQMEIFATCDSIAATAIDGGEIILGCFSLPAGFFGETEIVGFENPSDYIIRISSSITNDYPGEFRFQLIGQDEAVSVNELDEKLVSFYPNPAMDILTVDPIYSGTLVNIYSLGGKLLLSKVLNSRTDLNISSLPSGMYLLQVNHKNSSSNEKLIIH